MKTISIHVDEQVYNEFQRLGQLTETSAAEHIRNAMKDYSRKKVAQFAQSISELSSFSMGQESRENYENLMEDMLNA